MMYDVCFFFCLFFLIMKLLMFCAWASLFVRVACVCVCVCVCVFVCAVVYCIRLARASSDVEKKIIEKEMASDRKLVSILQDLQRTRATSSEHNIERTMLKEVRNLKYGSDSAKRK